MSVPCPLCGSCQTLMCPGSTTNICEPRVKVQRRSTYLMSKCLNVINGQLDKWHTLTNVPIMTQRARLEVGISRLPKPPCWNTVAQGEVGSDTCPALPPILALSSTLSSFMPTVSTPQTAHWAHYTGSWSLVALWPRVFPTSGAIYSSKDRLGMRSAKALKSGRKSFG